MDRKAFIKSAGCLCGAGALATILMTSESCAPKTQIFKATTEAGKALIPVSLFSSGNIQVVKVQGLDDKVAVVKKADGTFNAFEMKCTHAGASLKVNGEDFDCPLHGSQFNANGEVKKGPAKRALKNFKVVSTGDNIEISVG